MECPVIKTEPIDDEPSTSSDTEKHSFAIDFREDTSIETEVSHKEGESDGEIGLLHNVENTVIKRESVDDEVSRDSEGNNLVIVLGEDTTIKTEVSHKEGDSEGETGRSQNVENMVIKTEPLDMGDETQSGRKELEEEKGENTPVKTISGIKVERDFKNITELNNQRNKNLFNSFVRLERLDDSIASALMTVRQKKSLSQQCSVEVKPEPVFFEENFCAAPALGPENMGCSRKRRSVQDTNASVVLKKERKEVELVHTETSFDSGHSVHIRTPQGEVIQCYPFLSPHSPDTQIAKIASEHRKKSSLLNEISSHMHKNTFPQFSGYVPSGRKQNPQNDSRSEQLDVSVSHENETAVNTNLMEKGRTVSDPCPNKSDGKRSIINSSCLVKDLLRQAISQQPIPSMTCSETNHRDCSTDPSEISLIPESFMADWKKRVSKVSERCSSRQNQSSSAENHCNTAHAELDPVQPCAPDQPRTEDLELDDASTSPEKLSSRELSESANQKVTGDCPVNPADNNDGATNQTVTDTDCPVVSSADSEGWQAGGRSRDVVYPSCECLFPSWFETEEADMWKSVSRPGGLFSVKNLGLLRFVGKNLFSFLKDNRHYVLLPELEFRGLLQFEDDESELVRQLLETSLIASEVRPVEAEEEEYIEQFIWIQPIFRSRRWFCKMVTPLGVHLLFQGLYAYLKKPKWFAPAHALFYTMKFGHHCKWSLQVTPPVFQMGVEGQNQPVVERTLTRSFCFDKRKGYVQAVMVPLRDGGAGTSIDNHSLSPSLKKALRHCLGLFHLDRVAEPFCDCDVNVKETDTFRPLNIQSVAFPHVTHAHFMGSKEPLHCWKRPSGFYISLTELIQKNHLPPPHHEVLQSLLADASMDTDICVMLEPEKLFLDKLKMSTRERHQIWNCDIMDRSYEKRQEAIGSFLQDQERVIKEFQCNRKTSLPLRQDLLISLFFLRKIYTELAKTESVFSAHPAAKFYIKHWPHACPQEKLSCCQQFSLRCDMDSEDETEEGTDREKGHVAVSQEHEEYQLPYCDTTGAGKEEEEWGTASDDEDEVLYIQIRPTDIGDSDGQGLSAADDSDGKEEMENAVTDGSHIVQGESGSSTLRHRDKEAEKSGGMDLIDVKSEEEHASDEEYQDICDTNKDRYQIRLTNDGQLMMDWSIGGPEDRQPMNRPGEENSKASVGDLQQGTETDESEVRENCLLSSLRHSMDQRKVGYTSHVMRNGKVVRGSSMFHALGKHLNSTGTQVQEDLDNMEACSIKKQQDTNMVDMVDIQQKHGKKEDGDTCSSDSADKTHNCTVPQVSGLDVSSIKQETPELNEQLPGASTNMAHNCIRPQDGGLPVQSTKQEAGELNGQFFDQASQCSYSPDASAGPSIADTSPTDHKDQNRHRDECRGHTQRGQCISEEEQSSISRDWKEQRDERGEKEETCVRSVDTQSQESVDQSSAGQLGHVAPKQLNRMEWCVPSNRRHKKMVSSKFSMDMYPKSCKCPADTQCGVLTSFSVIQCFFSRRSNIIMVLNHVGQAVVSGHTLFTFNHQGRLYFSLAQLQDVGLVTADYQPHLSSFLGPRQWLQRATNDEVAFLAYNNIPLSMNRTQSLLISAEFICNLSYDKVLVTQQLKQLNIFIHRTGHICAKDKSQAGWTFGSKRDHGLVLQAWSQSSCCQTELREVEEKRLAGIQPDINECIFQRRSKKVYNTSFPGAISTHPYATDIGSAVSSFRLNSVCKKKELITRNYAIYVRKIKSSELLDKEPEQKGTVFYLCSPNQAGGMDIVKHKKVTVKDKEQSSRSDCESEWPSIFEGAMLPKVFKEKNQCLKTGVGFCELDTATIQQWIGDKSSTHNLFLTGTLCLGPSPAAFCCFKLNNKLYVNWGEVTSYMVGIGNLFSLAHRLHITMYNIPKVLVLHLNRHFDANRDVISTKPWVCVDSLIAMGWLGLLDENSRTLFPKTITTLVEYFHNTSHWNVQLRNFLLVPVLQQPMSSTSSKSCSSACV